MTTAAASLTISLAGTGEATIDWGGVTEIKTLGTLTAYASPAGMPSGSKTVKITAKNGVTGLECTGSGLTALDVSNNTALLELTCGNNSLSVLNVSRNTALTKLYCNGNSLSVLDLSKNTALLDLNCGSNSSLSVLDLSKNTKLHTVDCNGNSLSVLDVSKNLDLGYLNCGGNDLTGLNVSNNAALTALYFTNCNFNAAQLDALFNTLNDVDSGETKYLDFITGNPGATTCDRTIATAKHWTIWE